MAKYNVTHKCGHEVVHNLYGKMSERENRIKWLEDGVCAECYKAEQLKKAQEATSDLLELVGSEKQIAWATQIRAQRIEELDKLMAVAKPKPGYEAFTNKVISAIKNETDSGLWIETRDQTIKEIVGAVSRRIQEESK